MKLVYDVKDRPKFKANLVFALQQLLAIIAATLLVPTLVNLSYGKEVLNQAAALLGAGVGTLTCILVTQRKSPVFLGSSFAFISPLVGAAAFGAFGIILGAVIAGLVYVIIALVVRFVGTKWVEKLLPPVVIGPTVALIGLSLCGSAINNVNNTAAGDYNLICILIGLVTFGVTVLASVKGSKGMKLIPFIIGIASGYALAAIFTVIGNCADIETLKIIDFSKFSHMQWVPDFTFVEAFKGLEEGITPSYIGTLAVA